jgi:acyl-CoA reductase-like NAD-dependent aldehyde dehydrogenase
MAKTKLCPKCGEEKSLTKYSKHKRSKDGLQYWCKACSNKHREDNKDRHKEYQKEWRKNNKEYNKKWQSENREHRKEYLKKWESENRELRYARNAERRAQKLNATPDWLTEDHHKEIQQFYWLAKDLQAVTGETYHVDHIVPLKSETVCGLHVPWNLQVLPADVNIAKKNRYWPDMW